MGMVENLQRRATKYILNNFEMSYMERLNQCQLLPLINRREFLDHVFVYNNYHGLIESNLLTVIEFENGENRNRDEMMIVHKRVNLECYRNYFTNRVPYSWNRIPHEIRSLELTDMESNISFKNALKSWLYNHFLDNFDLENTCSWGIICNCARCRVV
jgi:hypothetical protein